MSLDNLFGQIGQLGRYQWQLVILASLASTLGTAGYFSQILSAVATPHWCQVEEWIDENCSEYGYDAMIHCDELKRSVSIPQTENGFSQCEKYNVTGLEFDVNLKTANLTVIECDDGWAYDTRDTGRTLISQFDLVCGKEHLLDITQSLYFLGTLIGMPLYGILSDRIGRLYSWALCIIHSLIFAIAIVFARNYWLYSIFRILMGAANLAVWTIPFVYVTEVVGHKKRMFAGLFFNFFWAIGYLFFVSMAWIIKDCIFFEVVIVVVHVVILPILCIIPESPRWLLAVGQVEKAEKILSKIAARNGREMPPNYKDEIVKERKSLTEEASRKHEISPLDIVLNRSLLKWTVIFNICWFAHGVTYFGLSYMSADFGFPFYPSFFISAVVEVPAYVTAMILLSYMGRKIPVIICMLLAGTSCIVATLIPFSVWTAVSVFAAKFFISISFVVLIVFTSEIYPTVIRGFGFSLGHIMAQIGEMLLPLVVLLTTVWEPLPLVSCAALTIIGGLLVVFLPETRGTMLPETLKDSEDLGKRTRVILDDVEAKDDMSKSDF